MPSILTNTRYQAYATGLLVIIFMIAGLYYGAAPDALTVDTFGNVLRTFARDQQTRLIVVAILIDLVTGVICSLRVGTFDGQKLAAFLGSNVLPYVLGYMLLWFLSYGGFSDILPAIINNALASFGFSAVMATLTMSIADNCARASRGSVPPDDAFAEALTSTPQVTRG